jgi:hypothetical protein
MQILLLIKVKRSLMTGLQALQGSILFLHASIAVASILGPLWFYFEPPQLLRFDFDGVRVRIRLFPVMRIRLSPLMRIRIRLPKMMRIHANLDPQHCAKTDIF